MAKSVSIKTSTGNKVVKEGSKAYSKYTSQGGTVLSGSAGKQAKAEVSSRLRSLNDPSSSNYGFEGFGSQAALDASKIPGVMDDNKLSPNEVPGAINTSQPSPGNVPVGAQNAPQGTVAQQAPDLSKIVGAQYYDQKTGQLNEAGNKYKQALGTLQASGPAPQDAGVGKMQAAAALQTPAAQPVSPLGGIMETDANFDSIFTNLDKYMEPLQQKKSLLQEYKSMSKALGIDEINEELIDAKRIIEGTEDDIRAEVTAAGGFATESQVLALSNARNKSLIKNYNVLLESRDNAMQQLDTMMDLTIEDRKAAEAEFDRKMDFAFKIADFKQKAKDNSTAQLNKIVDNVGYKGLLEATNGNLYEQSIIEKTLGLGTGGLQRLAALPPSEEEQLDLELKRSQLLTDQAQRAKIYSDMNADSGNSTLNGKPQTQAEATAQGYADRLTQSNDIISTLGSQFTGKFAQLPTLNALKSPERQSYEQAKKNFTTAILRRESGAAIGEQEYETADKQYFPQRGDSTDVLLQKEFARATAINNFYREANIPNPLQVDLSAPDGIPTLIID